MENNQQPTRVNDILLGSLERPALYWLANRMPKWVGPDLLTLTGFAGSILVGVSYWLTELSDLFLWLASLGLIINWFGDSLDGTIARVRKTERPNYGFFVDHSLDVLGGFCIALGIGLSPYVDFNFAMIALVGYLLMSVSVYVRTNVTGVFQMSYFRVGTTEIRLFIIIANAIIYFVGNPIVDTMVGVFKLYDLIALGMGTILIFVFMIVTLSVALKLRSIESL